MGSDQNLVLQSPTEENTFLEIDQNTYFQNLLATTDLHQKEQMMVATGPDENTQSIRIKGRPNYIDPTRSPQELS